MPRKPFVRQRILDAAFDLFASEGYEAVSTRAIAVAAEVGPASMFKHFATKEALAVELYATALAPIEAAFRTLAETRPEPRRALRAAVELLYGFYDARPRALALLIFPPHEITPREVDPADPGSVRGIISRLVAPRDADLAAIVWGAVTGPIEDRYLRRRLGAMSPHASAHADRVLRLIEPPGASP